MRYVQAIVSATERDLSLNLSILCSPRPGSISGIDPYRQFWKAIQRNPLILSLSYLLSMREFTTPSFPVFMYDGQGNYTVRTMGEVSTPFITYSFSTMLLVCA